MNQIRTESEIGSNWFEKIFKQIQTESEIYSDSIWKEIRTNSETNSKRIKKNANKIWNRFEQDSTRFCLRFILILLHIRNESFSEWTRICFRYGFNLFQMMFQFLLDLAQLQIQLENLSRIRRICLKFSSKLFWVSANLPHSVRLCFRSNSNLSQIQLLFAWDTARIFLRFCLNLSQIRL